MGGSDRDSAGLGPDRVVGPVHARACAHVSRGLRRGILALCLVLGGLLLPGSAALASGGLGHIFSSQLSFKGSGKCAFTEPGGVAVDNSNGDVYVFDRATDSVDWFNKEGVCLLHRKLGKEATSVGEASNEGIAVDNSPTSPSFGDVYAVNAEEKSILKLKPEPETGKLKLLRRIFTKKEQEEGNEFQEIHGIAVDASGGLWVYEGESYIDHFSSAVANKELSQAEVESPSGCAPRPGFAVTLNAEFFYVGRQRENRKGECEEATVLVKLNSGGGAVEEPPRNSQLDNENTTGFAIEGGEAPGGGNVYFDNKTNISAFTSSKLFIQRFGNEEGSALKEGAGVAVDSTTNDVYVADAHEGWVKVYVPHEATPTPPEPWEKEPPKLIDNRAWEMVTPPNKFGAAIYALGEAAKGVVQASEDGSAITYVASGPIVAKPPANRSPEPAAALSRRGSNEWSTQDIVAPRTGAPTGYNPQGGTEYRFFSSDLSLGLVWTYPTQISEAKEPPLSPEATEATPYWRNLTPESAACEPTPSTCYAALVSPANDTLNLKYPFGLKLAFLSATEDARHAVLKSEVALTSEAEATGEPEGLYEWACTSGQSGGLCSSSALQLVSQLPAGAGEERTAAGLTLGRPGSQGDTRHAISNDGSRVIWSEEEGHEAAGKLYLRDTIKGETIRVDKAQGVAQPEEAGAVFQTASADGSKIFFTDNQRLTPNPHEEEAEAEEGVEELYVCEVAEVGGKLACKLTDLTAEVGAVNESGAVQGVLGASEDGTYVYFVADGVLAEKAGRGECTLEPASTIRACNLYVEHYNGELGHEGWEKPKFIAALTTEDGHDWILRKGGAGTLDTLTSRVSPDGQYLAFMSNRPLTGYNNVDTHLAAEGARDEEVFLYNASTDRVLCASCNPTNEAPTGVHDTANAGEGSGLVIDRIKAWEGRWLAANIPGWTTAGEGIKTEQTFHQPRYLSDSGRLFFNSADALVPAATNHKADVYQYEPNGVGSCESSTGCVALISSGTSKQESAFLDASASGNDVFFLTASPLVPVLDKDTAFDIYDARVCTTSSPCLTPQEPHGGACAEEAGENTCKALASSEPALPSAPPTALAGPGNAGTHQVLGEKTTVKPKAVPLTRAQKLKKALAACKKLKKKTKRGACEKQAKKKYGPPPKKGKSTKPSSKGKK